MSRNDESLGATSEPTLPGELERPVRRPVPGLVLAWSPEEQLLHDRTSVLSEVVIGRKSTCDWCIRDKRLSREHLAISPAGLSAFRVRDLGSRNGVFANGRRLRDQEEVAPGAVLRAGSCVFVTVPDLQALAPPGKRDEVMAGKFYSWVVAKQLRVAARTGHHLLLEGETGVGKELAAQSLHRLWGELGRGGVFLAHNAAFFAGQDDAVGTLFGVSPGAFTGVEARSGALEMTDGGTLFLDEIHALPLRVQRSLLRFLEDGRIQPLGQPAASRPVDVRLILGTNVPVERACDWGQLAHDLVARLHRFALPPLRERRADIPSIFLHLLRANLPQGVAQAIIAATTAGAMERLCLHDYRQANVRELIRICSVMAARIAEGEGASEAVAGALDRALGPPPSPPRPPPRPAGQPTADPSDSYEAHRREILTAYEQLGGNLSRMESELRARGIPCSRRWLAEYLARWGVRPIPRRKKS